MANRQQTRETGANASDQRLKAAGRCLECGSVYSAWVLADGTVQPIGRKDGCKCGASEFEAISMQSTNSA